MFFWCSCIAGPQMVVSALWLQTNVQEICQLLLFLQWNMHTMLLWNPFLLWTECIANSHPEAPHPLKEVKSAFLAATITDVTFLSIQNLIPPILSKPPLTPKMAPYGSLLSNTWWAQMILARQKMASSPLVRWLFYLKCQSSIRNTGTWSESEGGLSRYSLKHQRM